MIPSKLFDLNPAPYNPKIITRDAFEGLKTSVVEFGDLSGIVFNQQTGNLVAGHQRVAALKLAGDLPIETDEAGNLFLLHGSDRFPVRLVDWPLEKEKLANVAANNPKIQGAWSDDIGVVLDDIMSTGNPILKPLQIPELAKMVGIDATDEGEGEEAGTGSGDCPHWKDGQCDRT